MSNKSLVKYRQKQICYTHHDVVQKETSRDSSKYTYV